MPGGAPFNIKIAFNASGDTSFTGPGTITELWYSGRQWRYDQKLADYSETRMSSNGRVSAKGTESLPLHVGMLRAAMFWPVGGNPSNGALRSAEAKWNGRPVTCFLLSANNEVKASPGRQWEETEYCVDKESGLLQIYSRAPGTYVVYDYAGNLQFHGRQVPDQIAIFVSGKSVLEGKVTIEDANPADANLTADAGMVPAPVNNMNMRFPLAALNPAAGSGIQPVIVNATIDTKGNVVEAEISAASNPALASSALDVVKNAKFGPAGAWRQAYINVRFTAGQ